MASNQDPTGDQVCMICLETTDLLKVVTTCKHAFCKNCLSNHIESLGEAEGSFPCPTCHVDCPLPENPIDALKDFTPGDTGDEGNAAEARECRCCRFTKNATVDAASLCQECGNVYLCRDCTVVHGRNQVTADHGVISVKALKKKNGTKCKKHDELVSSYCCDCHQPCCFLCVMLEHGDHDVKRIGEVFRSLVQEVKSAADDHERRAKDLQVAEDQLKFLRGSEVSQRRNILIQEIEDQAEKCIDQIAIQKNELKQKVEGDYKVVTEVAGLLDKVPLAIKLETNVAKSRKFLSTAEPHPQDIEHLSVIKQKMVGSGFSDEIDVDRCWESYKKLFDNPVQFVPNGQNYHIGRLEVKANASKKLENCKLIFEKALVVDDVRKYIPSVANLGNGFYAIAHPTLQGTLSEAIDIYKIPGDFQRTITDHANRIYDMAATPDGHLAVLADGAVKDTCNVRLFDAENGYVRSTKDFTLRGPLSLAVSLKGQYAILNVRDDGMRSVSIVSAEGLVEFMQVIAQPDASRITCCARAHYVVIGPNSLVVYEVKGKSLTKVTNSDWSLHHTDVSATWFGEITVGYVFSNKHKFLRRILQNKALTSLGQLAICGGVQGAARLSVRAGYIVSSQDHTIRVFK